MRTAWWFGTCFFLHYIGIPPTRGSIFFGCRDDHHIGMETTGSHVDGNPKPTPIC